MNKKINIILILVLFISCSKKSNPTSSSDSTSKHIYPLTVGNQWIYSVGDTITIDMTSTASNGKTSYHIQGDDDYTFGVRYLYYAGNVLYGYEYEDEIFRMFKEDSLLSTLPTAKVSVPAGIFDTYKLTFNNDGDAYWFAKGYGVVKAIQNGETRDLVKYTIR